MRTKCTLTDPALGQAELIARDYESDTVWVQLSEKQDMDLGPVEAALRREFGRFGVIKSIDIPLEHGHQCHKGYGFVTFAERVQAGRALSCTSFVFHGKVCKVAPAKW